MTQKTVKNLVLSKYEHLTRTFHYLLNLHPFLPGSGEEGEGHEDDPGEGDEDQDDGGQRLDAGDAGGHLAQEVSHIEHRHEHQAGPGPEAAGGQQGLHPGVEADQ